MCLDVCREMTSVETKYFDLNRILLLAIGLWPYKQSKLVRFQLILFFGILISCIIFQVYFNTFYYVVSHYIFKINALIVFTQVFSMCCLFIVILLPILTPVLDIPLHINGSQPRRVLHFMTEYFIDQEKYFYIILLHSNAVVCIGATTVTATGTLLIRGYLIHACELFKIASVVPVHTKRLILFILRRSSKAFALNVGQIFVAPLECFATLLKASMSYFTFMYSMQQ
ncbi:uncharacterized protein [Temnothorax longispinosus]|uniref:uncharacterized protein n=1 Tax=Temnothorax longispinosus TaxID=300112 RepID=UPI003A9A039B